MPATSSLANRIGKESRSRVANDLTLESPSAPSTFTARISK